jgi:hypothetical protein
MAFGGSVKMFARGARLWVAAFALAICAPWCRAAPEPSTAFGSQDVRDAARWVMAIADNHRQPFAIVDKRAAHIYVFDLRGHLVGQSPVLLGMAVGDASVPDIARRLPGSLSAGERTTPAGRFASEPGHNDKGEAIVWFDYEASLAIHRLRPAPAREQRAERMASPSPADRRISAGCIVLPVGFYEAVVSGGLGRQRGVVYVLPETRPAHSMFDEAQVSMRAP